MSRLVAALLAAALLSPFAALAEDECTTCWTGRCPQLAEKLKPCPDPQKGAPAATKAAEGLTPAAVSAVISRRKGAVEGCYRKALLVKPKLSGVVAVALEIGPTGEVVSLTIASDTTNDSVLTACVRDVMKDARFPPPVGGGTVNVTYPFAFKPEASRSPGMP